MEKTYDALFYLIVGFIASSILAYLTYANVHTLFPYCWVSLYGFMLIFSYRDAKSFNQLIVISAVMSMVGALSLAWSNTDSNTFVMSNSPEIIGMLSAYILTIWNMVYQANRFTFRYADLVFAVWNTISQCLIGLLFLGFSLLILFAWGQLFEAIGIFFFSQLFFKAWFLTGATSFLLGVGLYIAIHVEKITSQLRKVIFTSLKYLFPVFAIGCIVFLLSWGYVVAIEKKVIRFDASLFLYFSFLSILFLNAVYQTGDNGEPYPKGLQWIINIFLILNPIFATLAIYGLLFASKNHYDTATVINAILLLITTLLYAIAVLLRETPWLRSLKKINICLSVLVVLVALASNNPWYHNQRIQTKIIYQTH